MEDQKALEEKVSRLEAECHELSELSAEAWLAVNEAKHQVAEAKIVAQRASRVHDAAEGECWRAQRELRRMTKTDDEE